MPKTFKFLRWSGKKAVVFCALTVVLSVTVLGVTLAYVIDKTDPITNTFPTPNIGVDITGDVIKNTGDIPVYVRAAVVANWVMEDGSILATSPVEGTDYKINFNTTDWVQGSDGFWYYKTQLGPYASANELMVKDNAQNIDKVTQLTTMEGATLSVQIISSAIQATPADAVVNSWSAVTGIDSNGNLIVTPKN